MEELVDTIKAIINQAETWPISVLLCVCLIVFAIIVKRARWFPNRFIPTSTCLLGGVLNYFIGDISKVLPTQRYPEVVLILWGFFIGAVAYVAFRIAMIKFEKYLTGDSGDTAIIAKPPPPK